MRAIDPIDRTELLKKAMPKNPDAEFHCVSVKDIMAMPSAEPETSRIEQELHGKTPEEQYDFIYWLLFKSFEATAYSNSRLAIIDWLKGDRGNG